MKRRCATNICAHEWLEPRRLLSAGDPDPSFGVDGRVEGAQVANQLLDDAAVLPDDKVLFAGRRGREYFLQRFNADGTADATFGASGMVTGFFGDDTDSNFGSMIHEIVPRLDGTVVARGSTANNTVIARFTAGGALDTTFGGGDGFVELPEVRYDLAFGVMDNGKILISHDRVSIGGPDAQLHRYNADGSPDTAFGGGDGIVSNPAGLSSIRRIESYGGDRILLAGGVFVSGQGTHGAIARLHPDGSRDDTFGGGDGRIDVTADALLPLPGGQFLGVSDGGGAFSTVRYGADGNADVSYGGGGTSVVPIGGSTDDIHAFLDGDGNAVLVAESSFAILATRLEPDGDLDETFGRVVSVQRRRSDAFLGAGVQSDGKPLLLSAESNDVSTDWAAISRLLAEDPSPSPIVLHGRVLSVPGTAGNDVTQVEEFTGAIQARRNRWGRAFDVADVDSVSVSGRGGDDLLAMLTRTVPANVNGGDGFDRIAGGAANDTLDGGGARDLVDGGDGGDLIAGGGGNDAIRGLLGDDTLLGGSGDDDLRGNEGTDTYDGGPGDDVEIDIDIPDVTFDDGLLRYFDRANKDDIVSIFPDNAGGLVIYVDGATNTIPIRLVGMIELNGNGGHDYLKVHPFLRIRARLYGGLGGETSVGGNDTLIGGAHNDTLIGHDGDDFLFANDGHDVLIGDRGADVLRGHRGRDTVSYEFEADGVVVTLDDMADDGVDGENDLAFADIERVIGSSGSDRLIGGAGTQTLYGGRGHDTLSGGPGNDLLYGAEHNDRLDGGEGDDHLEGGAGHDVLAGGPGADTLLALNGNDVLLADDGVADTVRGGAGTDTGEVDDQDDVLAVEALS